MRKIYCKTATRPRRFRSCADLKRIRPFYDNIKISSSIRRSAIISRRKKTREQNLPSPSKKAGKGIVFLFGFTFEHRYQGKILRLLILNRFREEIIAVDNINMHVFAVTLATHLQNRVVRVCPVAPIFFHSPQNINRGAKIKIALSPPIISTSSINPQEAIATAVYRRKIRYRHFFEFRHDVKI